MLQGQSQGGNHGAVLLPEAAGRTHCQSFSTCTGLPDSVVCGPSLSLTHRRVYPSLYQPCSCLPPAGQPSQSRQSSPSQGL